MNKVSTTNIWWRRGQWRRLSYWKCGIEEIQRKSPAWINKWNLSHAKNYPILLRKSYGGPHVPERRRNHIVTGLLSRRTPGYLSRSHVQVYCVSLFFLSKRTSLLILNIMFFSLLLETTQIRLLEESPKASTDSMSEYCDFLSHMFSVKMMLARKMSVTIMCLQVRGKRGKRGSLSPRSRCRSWRKPSSRLTTQTWTEESS